LSAITTVLFTHGHDDHFSPGELQYRGRYFVTPPPTNPLALYGPHDVVDQLKCLLSPELMDFSLHVVEAERPVMVAGYEAFPFLANHDESITCLNYVMKSPDGACLLYASDTGWYQAETWGLLEQFRLDAVVVECTKREDAGYSGHLSIPEVFRMRRRLLDSGILRPDAPIIATHFSHQMGLTHDELEAVLGAEGVLAAYDGMTIEISAGS
jgi:phosphoribosyl 1,2-cyclic phosphate phosphodiesterase